ncbi:hypothetical protein LMG3441_00187 [Achromobacter kerstersii]|uniref:PAS domain-containing protein n=1 Tax=Achromobacter kerstersii TaxID=1353890 RepID=A0A6S6Z4D2_9BURK|nr:hypothetical protein LMG3441_00187 [Achromobacter kerstersii]
MRNNQPVYDKEYTLHDEQYLISRTDARGRIIYANPAFVEVSGFTREELVGAAHNIVRHPDMPEDAFADLWRTIQRGESWTGVVKNRRKDGGYYWVLANVTPIIERGVTSVMRRCVSNPLKNKLTRPMRCMRGCATAPRVACACIAAKRGPPG